MTETLSDSPTIALAGAAAHSTPPSSVPCRFWALIPCAGQGTRAGSALPKQYHPVAGRALVLHTLAAFAGVPRMSHSLVVLAPTDAWFAALDVSSMPNCSAVACGAATRAGTVAHGLRALRALGALDDDWVLVHDAARCLVTPALIDRLIDACVGDAVGGLLAIPVSDTVKRASDGRVADTVDRRLYWLAQTPQMFRLGVLESALLAAADSVTDEASAIEAQGLAPRLVEGDRSNFKVTVAQDFIMAEAILLARDTVSNKDSLA
jgi:2-C-methyl-D-erythritol 4-phosphate cytidylyltransferase